MGYPSRTRALLDAQRKGQEIVTYPAANRAEPAVPVLYEPRTTSDPRPWTLRNGDRFSGAQCFARLPLPLPAGTVLENVHDRRRGLYVGPGSFFPSTCVMIDIPGVGTMEVSRSMLRQVQS